MCFEPGCEKVAGSENKYMQWARSPGLGPLLLCRAGQSACPEILSAPLQAGN